MCSAKLTEKEFSSFNKTPPIHKSKSINHLMPGITMSELRDHLGQMTHLTDGKPKCRGGTTRGQGHTGKARMGTHIS